MFLAWFGLNTINHLARRAGHLQGNANIFVRRVFTPEVIVAMRESLAVARRAIEEAEANGSSADVSAKRIDLIRRRLEKTNTLTEYTARFVEHFNLYERTKSMAPGAEKTTALKAARKVIEDLRDEVFEQREKYDGVVGGAYYKNRLLMARHIERLRRMIDLDGHEPPESDETPLADQRLR